MVVDQVALVEEQDDSSTVRYIANNNNDQQYLVRLGNFLEKFLTKCLDESLLKWVPRFTEILVKKATRTPRVSKLYCILKTILQVCSKYKYFENM